MLPSSGLVEARMRMTKGEPRARRGRAAVLGLATGLLALAPTRPVSAATPCEVKNPRRGAQYETLQQAVDAAAAGDKLRVAGLCVGSTIIDRKLTIAGVRASGASRPILDGDRAGRVLEIEDGVVVRLQEIVVRRGNVWTDGDETADGGGILNRGNLILTDVSVLANTAERGGGIFSTGELTLTGATSIARNETVDTDGGGIALDGGRLIVKGATRIRDNVAARGGGGIYGVNAEITLEASSAVHDNRAATGGGGVYGDFETTVVLKGSAAIRHNRAAERGGGVFDGTRLTMSGSSSITDNVAGTRGGGIFAGCYAELTGADPGGNVAGNRSGDVRFEQGCP